MDNMVLWLVIAGAAVVAGISVMLLQKKASEAQKLAAEINSLKNQLDGKNSDILALERNREVSVREEKKRSEELAGELSRAEAHNKEQAEELENLKVFQTGQAEGLDKLEVELNAVKEQLRQTEKQRDKNAAELVELSKKAAEAKDTGDAGMQEELAAIKADLADKKQKLAAAEKDFAEQMDEVVQSSIQKITHAEEAKEEAIRAAEDNFEAAAEVNSRLKEAEAKLAKLQG